jgi:predicted RNA-binding Zn-ribbon protein involved in translation (DUF1610 family)
MRGYFGLGQLSATEKSDILNQHKSVYNGYQTMQPQVSNTQPLTVYDFAGDKDGMVVNNKGEVKKYTNMGINEQVEESKEVCDECGAMEMSESECSECGGMMYEGECSECGWKGQMDEETGHLDDIYKVKDLNLSHGDFDYVEGGGNDYGTFEGMHKGLYKEQDEFVNYVDNFEDPDNEDDGFEDLETGEEIDEQGGNVNDMNVSDVESAYDFESNGPMAGGDVYPVNEDGECEECWEPMESAWADEIDEVDVSGSQGVYGDMDPAFDFDSEGPGKAGPYQEFSNEGETDEQYLPKHAWKKMARQQAANDKGEEFDPHEFDPSDYEDLDPLSSWEDIKSYFGDNEWSEVDEDLQESFLIQKNKITEMFNRFSKYN